MLSRMLGTIREHGLVAAGERVLVALSGGPDSTALLHGLVHLAPRLGVGLEAAVIDHGLRPGSAREAAAVAAAARAQGIPCEVVSVDVGARRGPHVSTQDAARRARLAALEAVASRRGCARVALGHTADDQAETILFRIVRGTGLRGLAGIPYRRGRFVRPLLDVRRDEILRFLRRRKVVWVEDPSNRDRRFARSRVRHEWLPFLSRENPRLVDALLALGAEARARRGTGTAAAPGLPGRAARVVARLAAEGRGTRLVSVRGGTVEVSYGAVRFRPGGAPAAATRMTGMLEVRASGLYRLGPPGGPALEVRAGEGPRARGPGEAVFDLDRVDGPLRLRPLRPGDRMRPRAGRGSRKLSDLLIDAKVPRPRRALLFALVAADDTILYVPGLRPAEAGRPTAGTRRWIEVRLVERPASPEEAGIFPS